jgi:hypothetical protein
VVLYWIPAASAAVDPSLDLFPYIYVAMHVFTLSCFTACIHVGISTANLQTTFNIPAVAVTHLHVSRSQQNRSTLQDEQRSPGEWRQLATRSVAKLATLYCWLRGAVRGVVVKSFRGLEACSLVTATITLPVFHNNEDNIWSKGKKLISGWIKLHNEELITCTLYQILVEWENEGEWDGRDM